MTTAVKKTNLIPCVHCGKEITAQAKFCNYCGKKQETAVTAIPQSPVFEAAEQKNTRNDFLQLVPILAAKIAITQQDLVELNLRLAAVADLEQEEILSGLVTLIKTNQKYLYRNILKFLEKKLSTDVMQKFVLRLIKEDSAWFTPIIIDSGVIVNEKNHALLKDQAMRVHSEWLDLKFTQLPKK